jgi:hypothetical protein
MQIHFDDVNAFIAVGFDVVDVVHAMDLPSVKDIPTLLPMKAAAFRRRLQKILGNHFAFPNFVGNDRIITMAVADAQSWA